MDTQVAKKDTRRKAGDIGVYMNSLLSRKIQVPFKKVGKNIKELLQNKIKRDIEGKCTIEGFIKPDSTRVLTYSSGVLFEDVIEFDVAFESLVCCPVEGMKIKCVIKNKTQAGIRAVINEDVSPVVIYITRDHHYNNKYFSTVEEGDEITAKVIGQRYELNDEQVSIIGEIVEPKSDKYKKGGKKMPKLILK
jgi:DNA-directed RNA polymerase subunit E'/Rpb7